MVKSKIVGLIKDTVNTNQVDDIDLLEKIMMTKKKQG